ncbi:MAG: VTT domain-containing protein [Dokdonella sp.]
MHAPAPQQASPPAQPGKPSATDGASVGVADSASEVHARRTWRRVIVLTLLLAVFAACLGWLILPIESVPSIAQILAFAQQAHTSPLVPFIALACFAIGGLVVFPVNLLIAATIVVFGPAPGALLALLGSLLSAIVVHEVGRAIPQAMFTRLFGARGERLRARVLGHGLLAVAIVRIVPVAPYSVVSLISGVARIRRRDYIAGTALGMLPGIVLYALFIDRARAVLLNPHPLAWAGLAGALALIVAVALAVRFWNRKHERRLG